MAQPKPFAPVKLICGVIFADPGLYDRVKAGLTEAHGPVDLESPAWAFDLTDYYEKEMGPGLARRFLSFRDLIAPDRLPAIKWETNALEDEIRGRSGRPARPVNIDPGYLTSAALVMATTKDFSHRVPLANGIYAHLEFLFTKTDVKVLDWTYPDMRRDAPKRFFLEVREAYLRQLKEGGG